MREPSTDLFQEQLRAWWTSVLVGKVDQPYPDRRMNLSASLEGDVLVISGTAPSSDDRLDLETQVKPFVGHEIAAVRNDVTVLSEERGDAGVLVQTLIGTFESAAQARFAGDILQNQAKVRPSFLTVLAPGENDRSDRDIAALRKLLTDDYWRDVQDAIAENHAVLIVTVDETEVFHVREILDEETRSLQTVVLPPDPAQMVTSVRQDLETINSLEPESARLEARLEESGSS